MTMRYAPFYAFAAVVVLGLGAACAVGEAQAEGGVEHAQESESAAPPEGEVDRVEFFLAPEVVYRLMRVRKVTFESEENVVPKLIPSTSQGIAPALAVGVRLWFVSIGLRGELGMFQGVKGDAFDNHFRFYNLDLELAFRAPLGRVEPWLLLGGGYSGLGGLSKMIDGSRRSGQSQGGNLRAGLGLDVFFRERGLFGARLLVDGVFLSSEVPIRDLAAQERVDTVGEAKARARDANGLVVGLSPSLGIVVGMRL